MLLAELNAERGAGGGWRDLCGSVGADGLYRVPGWWCQGPGGVLVERRGGFGDFLAVGDIRWRAGRLCLGDKGKGGVCVRAGRGGWMAARVCMGRCGVLP